MQYVNFVHDDRDRPTMHTGPVADSDAAYLRLAATHQQPLSDEQYLSGPAAILHTMAKYSYVLDGHELYWCIEWEPGLVIVRMSPDKAMEWTALRSPIPDFGGRQPLPEDGNDEDVDNNPQYNLIFAPWDAQFDQQDRELGSFIPADPEVQARFQNALERVNSLANMAKARYAEDRENWLQTCKNNLKRWSGEGVRLRPAR